MNSITHNPLINSHPTTQTQGTAVGGIVGWIDRAYGRFQERAAIQRELAAMSDREMRDARINRWDVEQEIARPFWRG